MYLYLANFNLIIFLFFKFSNQPPITNTYLNISICLCKIHSKRLTCMNVESCFCKYFEIEKNNNNKKERHTVINFD